MGALPPAITPSRLHCRASAAVLLLTFVSALAISGCRGDDPAPPDFSSTADPADSLARPTLEQKLERQWHHYDHAVETLIEHAGIRNRPLTPQQWQRLLLPEPAYRLNHAELEALRHSQRQRIESARALARDSSPLDLDTLRRLGDIEAFCHDLPKGALLHVHPNGTLDRETVHLMLDAANPLIDPDSWVPRLSTSEASFYPGELDFLRAYRQPVRYRSLRPEDRTRFAGLFHLPAGNHDFEHFAAIFRLLALVRDASDEFPESLIYDDFLRRARQHGVSYVEVTHSVDPTSAALDQWQRRADDAARQFDVFVRLNFALQRSRTSARNAQIVERLLRLDPPPVLVGIDVSGPELNHPAFDAAQSAYARLLALEADGHNVPHRTFHAAGLADTADIRDAILLGARRIGHAARLMDDPVLVEYGARLNLPVEANLTSNVRLRYVDSYESHPFLDLLRLGYRVSLSTDDEGILDTDISREFVHAVRHTDITYDEIRRLCFNSIETAFADPQLKARLLQQLTEEFDAFERRWSPRLARAD